MTNQSKLISVPFDQTVQQKEVQSQKIFQAYNKIGDFANREQIHTALKYLNTAQERSLLIDKILERKNEMYVAALKLKAKQLAPIFRVILRKLKKRQVNDEALKRSESAKKRTTQISMIKEHPLTTDNDAEIMEKLQSRFTTSFAFQWLSDRGNLHKKQSSIEEYSPTSQSRMNRRQTYVAQFIKQNAQKESLKSNKVSQNSNEFILQGQKKIESLFSKRIKIQGLIKKAKAKVDSRRQGRQQPLTFIHRERDDAIPLQGENHYQNAWEAKKCNILSPKKIVSFND